MERWTLQDPRGRACTIEVLKHHLDLYPEPERSQLNKILAESRLANKGFAFEGRMYTAKGNLRWVRVVGDVEVVDGVVVRRFGMKQDITEQKVLSEKVQHLANTDDLTGLYNRRGLREELAKVGGASFDGRVHLFIFDLDGFKDVNDNHGHGVGDACLRRVARRVKSKLEKDFMIARLGGDEFAVLSRTDEAGSQVEIIAKHIQDAVARPIIWRGQTFHLSCSIGIASQISSGLNPDEIIREADLALYEAKRAGRSCYRVFSSDIADLVSLKRAVLNDVRDALTEKRLELYYQPKIALADGKVAGFEALLRLNKTDGGVAAPGAFMSALEDPGLSKEIGDFAISSALDRAARWRHQAYPSETSLSIFSASQFRDPQFARDFSGFDKPATAGRQLDRGRGDGGNFPFGGFSKRSCCLPDPSGGGRAYRIR